MTPRYSVVIPMFNEEAAIVPCLTALTKQTTKEPFEVIVVDNNSTDHSAEVARKFSDKLTLRVIPETIQGRGAARRKGFSEAIGEIIISSDADTVVPPYWIETLVKGFKKPGVVATTTFCYIDDCSPMTNLLFNITQPISATVYRVFLHHYWLSGFSFAIRKDVYERSGGFDAEIDANEDTDLGKRVHKLGKILLVRDMKVKFSGRRFKNGFIKGMYPYLKTYIDLNIRHKKKTYLSSVRH